MKVYFLLFAFVFFFKQKTAYEMRISDWSSDVCSSDLEISLAARSLYGLADLAVEGGGDGFDENLYPRIARVPGVAVASPVVEVEARSEERRVGKECVRTCRSRWSTYS